MGYEITTLLRRQPLSGSSVSWSSLKRAVASTRKGTIHLSRLDNCQGIIHVTPTSLERSDSRQDWTAADPTHPHYNAHHRYSSMTARPARIAHNCHCSQGWRPSHRVTSGRLLVVISILSLVSGSISTPNIGIQQDCFTSSEELISFSGII